jgi:hypothetical protein
MSLQEQRLGPARFIAWHARASAPMHGAFVFAVAVLREAGRAQELGPRLDLLPGQEVTFPVAIVDGRITLRARARLEAGNHRAEGRRDHCERREERVIAYAV